MAKQQQKITRSIKDILVSHEERLQQIGELLKQGDTLEKSTISSGISNKLEVKMKNSEELQKKIMTNQRTFNNSLQHLNSRTSKLEQLLVEINLDIRNLKKQLNNKDNVSLEIIESYTKTKEGEGEGEGEGETANETKYVKEEVKDETKDETKDVKEEVKEEVHDEISKTKKVIINEDNNQEFETETK